MRRLLALALLLLLLLSSGPVASAAQSTAGSGLQVVADNVATASNAASNAPLLARPLAALDGSPSDRSIALPAGPAGRKKIDIQNIRSIVDR